MHYKLLKQPLFICIGIILCLNACIPSNTFEKNISMPKNKWSRDFVPHLEFDINDTACYYNMYLTMRHTDNYPYSNIWLNIKTLAPGELKFVQTRTEIPLAQADGKWLGRGMNEIFEITDHQMPLQRNGMLKFNRVGRYVVELQQIMRIDPLPEVMSVGIRLEKKP